MAVPVSTTVTLDVIAAGQIRVAAQAAYPEEACGLLLGRFLPGDAVEVARAVATANAAPPGERRRRFVISPRVLLDWDRAAATAGQTIVGFYHSHPDASERPSETDAASAWPGYVYLIVATAGRAGGEPIVGGMAAWTFDDAARSFREASVRARVEPDEIDYVI